MNRLDFTLTQAQVQALHTTPVELVPAPGAGSGLFLMFIAAYRTGADAFGDGGNVLLSYDNTLSQSVTYNPGSPIVNLFTAAGLKYTSFASVLQGAGLPILASAVVNKPLFIFSTAAFTGSGGSIKGTIFYSIVTMS